MIYTESEKDSLCRFMRVESSLVTFARSLRNDDPKQGDVKSEADPFAGIDFDNLPDEIKEQLTKAKESVATLQLDAKTTKEKLTKTEELARQQQARADRNLQRLKDHNLDPDGKSTTPILDEDAKNIAEMVAQYVAMGIEPKIAETQAKIQYVSQQQLEKRVLDKVGKGLSPALGAVSDMYAGKLLAEAQLPKNDKEGIFQIPEVADAVNTSLSLLVQQGQTVTADTITNLRNMAYGNYIITTPEDKRMKPNFSTGGLQFGSSNNQVATLQQQGKKGSPQAANQDTAEAIAKTVGELTRGFTFKKGAK